MTNAQVHGRESRGGGRRNIRVWGREGLVRRRGSVLGTGLAISLRDKLHLSELGGARGGAGGEGHVGGARE
eukprot:69206-Chlamydomonas_euryale.AAC.1